MYQINKIRADHVIDYAAEELKKYLRMMMPECGDIPIQYEPDAKTGFRLGLMQDFGLDVSDAENPELDDILYIDTDERGGIIAGDNPRSVLLSVYEFFRQNGCRWLMPGVDGEYIPMQDIKPVAYRYKPSCRYRGQCNEGAEYQSDMLEVIDFTPKIGMNVFMIEFFNPVDYYRFYYNHAENIENRPAEPISDENVLQWKRQCEAEISKRGLQFHDIGHGFACDPFGVDSSWELTDGDLEEKIPPESRQYLALVNGERKLFANMPKWTNFCMSNPKARDLVSDYVVNYAKKHSNIDYLHVWLADGTGNHCECPECSKKLPSDWYVMLLNEIDEKLIVNNLNTRIVFIVYTETIWAPQEAILKHPERFSLLLAPTHRSYAYAIPEDEVVSKLPPFKRNQNEPPKNLAQTLEFFKEWRKTWKGANIAYEYHFWRHQYGDLAGLQFAKRVHEDIKLYKKHGFSGIIEDGSQRSFFPNGLAFYTYARTLFDTSISYEELVEDYYSHAYGEKWELIRDYLADIYEALPFTFFSRDEACKKSLVHYDPVQAEKIASIRRITKEGRELIRGAYTYRHRIQTASLRLLERHADFCDLVSDWMAAKARGDLEDATRLLEVARIEFGKFELEIERYFDHSQCFSDYFYTNKQKSPSRKEVIGV